MMPRVCSRLCGRRPVGVCRGSGRIKDPGRSRFVDSGRRRAGETEAAMTGRGARDRWRSEVVRVRRYMVGD